MPNRLIHETSPYLLQHAHNPVDWYAWGEEALDRARREDKPILLSIGYSACHWCHVMEHESFENPDIAALMNRDFINIKVDREERPDLDSIYMAAVQAMTQRGGWPMTVFLTPEGQPFYGGTYFPPEDRAGMPGFPRVLSAVAEAYANRRDELVRSSDRLVEHLQQQGASHPASGAFQESWLREAAENLTHYFEPREGGFGSAPKFPQPMILEFLLRAYRRWGDARFLEMVELTLVKMAHGGMYDQIGGGFHRYSTDSRWLVPHFEKMLYDNAQLALVYLHAFQVTGRALYRRIAEETLDYVRREMTGSEGGFYSTQDADSEGEEGRFFVWTPAEVRSALGSDADAFMAYFDVTETGNWEGKNILHVVRDADSLASELGLSPVALVAALDRGRQKLLAIRDQRVHPGLDDKVLTSWNGMMLKAFAEAACALQRTDYADTARRAGAFLLDHMLVDGQLRRTRRGGVSKLAGYLEDYANAVDGLLSLYEAEFDLRWFDAVSQLAQAMIDQFWREDRAGFSDTGRHHEQLIAPVRDVFDNATPAGNSVAAEDLVRLWLFTADDRYRAIAQSAIAGLQSQVENYPLGFGRLCSAGLFLAGPAREIALVGPGDTLPALRQAIWSKYLPEKVVACAAEDDSRAAATIPLLAGRARVAGQPAAYVCQGFVCEAPVTEPAALAALLSSA